MPRRVPSNLLAVTASGVILAASGCAPVVVDPVATLADPAAGSTRHLAALEVLGGAAGVRATAATGLDAPTVAPLNDAPSNAATTSDVVHDVLWHWGYAPRVRGAAFDHLVVRDPAALRATLHRQLPYIEAYEGLEVLCERIAHAGWEECAPALVRSLSRPVPSMAETDRPEYHALASLWGGADRVTPGVLRLLRETTAVTRQGLRTRCWELLHRWEQREAVRRLVRETPPDARDAFLLDLQHGERELGILPHNREEILWLRSLYHPRHDAFRAAAVRVATAERAAGRNVELRDLPVLVAAAQAPPDRRHVDDATLKRRLDARLSGERHYAHRSNFDQFNDGRRDRIHSYGVHTGDAPPGDDARLRLTRGDLLTLTALLDGLGDPELRGDLFEFAERDRLDETTEHGGVFTIGDGGRLRAVDYPPRVRRHDQEYLAPEEMVEAAYTSLAHYHFHAQRHRNQAYAGPGYGDSQYAERMRANCVVLTFVGRDAMNVDFYRHGGVRVDLGVIRRPSHASNRHRIR